MKEKTIWKWCFIISFIVAIIIYGGMTLLASKPTWCNAFDNFFGTNIAFKGNPKGVLGFALLQSVIAIPAFAGLLRIVVYLGDEENV